MSSNNVISEQELPNWMKQAQRGVDWGAILVIGFCLIIAWSFLARDSLSAINDSEHYVYRAEDYADAIKSGNLYARWSPQALQGYGTPIPNFSPPGAAYSAAILDVLFTNDTIMAVRLVYAAAIIIAGSMVYAFVKQRTNALSGVFAALLYISNPFIGLTVPHVRGDLPLAVGIALIPMLLWAINRCLIRNHTSDYVVITLVYAAIIVTKPALLAQGLFLSVVLVAVHFSPKIQWKQFSLLSSAMISGVGLSAFYWMPALLERSTVKWANAILDVPDRRLTLSGFFEQTRQFDFGILIHEPQFNIGWVLITFTLLTIMVIIYRRQDFQLSAAFLLSSIIFSLLGLTIFPQNTELLVGIVLSLVIATSYSINMLRKDSIGYSLYVLAIVIIFIGAIPILNLPEPQVIMSPIDITSQSTYENNGWGIAVLPSGEAIPSFISPINQNLSSTYTEVSTRDGRIPKDISFQSTMLEEGAFGGRYQVITQDEATFTYLRAYSPRWQAFLDEQMLEVYADEDGLIQITVPAGTNAILTFSYGENRLSIIAWFVSAISLLIIIYVWRQHRQTFESNFDTSDLLTHNQIILLIVVLLLGAIFRYPPTSEIFSGYVSPAAYYSMENTIPVQNNVDGRFELWQFSFEERNYLAGDIVNLTLYWKLIRHANIQHQVRIRIISRQNQSTIMTTDFRYPGQYPSNRWPRHNVTMVDSYQLQLPQDLESGRYTILIDVSSCPNICQQGSEINQQTITIVQLPLNLIIE